jgi:hypothetical protein
MSAVLKIRLLLGGLLVAVAGIGCLGNPYASLVEVDSHYPPAARCGECHREIFEEWSASSHAESWTNAAFVETTSDRAILECLGCHAPDSIFGEGAPRLRDRQRDEGVTCVACHLHEGKLAGPAPGSALLEPHPIAEEQPIFLSAELCGKCHEGTLAEWNAAPEEGKRSCRECHMPPITRKLTQGSGFFSKFLVSFEEEFEGRRHSFHLGQFADFGETVEMRFEEQPSRRGKLRVAITVKNLLPHRIPTGDFGYRFAKLEFVAHDADGAELFSLEKVLFKELGQALEPGEERRFSYRVPEGTVGVSFTLSRGKLHQTPVVVQREEWSLR